MSELRREDLDAIRTINDEWAAAMSLLVAAWWPFYEAAVRFSELLRHESEVGKEESG